MGHHLQPLPRLRLSIPRRAYAPTLAVLALLASVSALRADDKPGDKIEKIEKIELPPALPAALNKAAPENIDDLKAIQKQVHVVLDKVLPCTVGVQIGSAQGSGVIVSKDGYVLTAGHVSGQPGRDVTLILQDGKKIKGKTLGSNSRIDSGMIKITEEKEWPFLEMGKSADLKRGQWVIAAGHPGGYRPGRTPPVRLGRVLDATDSLVRTDCTLVGGDSGGPLFDMEGKVIGIHSRINGPITSNIHVPVDTYRSTWDRLAKSEVFGGREANAGYLGIARDPDAKECRVKEVADDSPAGKGGIKADDIITKLDGQKVETYEDLNKVLDKKKAGDKVDVEVKRGEETLTLKVTLGKRPN
jgi:serine protease Do